MSTSACRFTVREIGFSILSQDVYTLIIIDETANAGDEIWKDFHTKNRDCNLHLEILNPITDINHPVVKNAKKEGIDFPATLLVSPDGKLFQFDEKEISLIYNEILESDLGRNLRVAFPDVFATVLVVEGTDEEKNSKVRYKVKEECSSIENIMPGMPKIVKNGPFDIVISKQDFQTEKLLMWSLGIDSIPNEPVVFVLYGRGRIMGQALEYSQIIDGEIYRFMSMIGADCECGLDKKWMLGKQIPMLWDKELRQRLAKLVGFDVDNPMILAEMSRILAKESLSDNTGSVAFAPETIDLDKAFGIKTEEQKSEANIENERRGAKILTYTLVSIISIILLLGMFILFGKKNKN